MPKNQPAPHLEPLVPREGAAYTCFGDGLCCTDIHELGPLTKFEAKAMEALRPQSVVRQGSTAGLVLAPAASGGCGFLLGDGRCGVHAEVGEDKKPSGCRRFPYRITATPEGGRVSTLHRCPCRTMGARPPLDMADARSVLRGGTGRLRADATIETKIRLTNHKTVSFAQWLVLEKELLGKLAAGVDPMAVLDVKPFPTTRGATWAYHAEEMVDAEHDDTAFASTVMWFGDAIREATGGDPMPGRARPWSKSFDRAEARSDGKRRGQEVMADWLADEIWCLEWSMQRTFAHAKRDWATRLAVGNLLRSRFESLGAGEERAAAEAVTIIDTVGYSEWWTDIESQFVV